MKKNILLFLAIFFSFSLFAQEEPTTEEVSKAVADAAAVSVKKNVEVPDSLNWKFSGIIGMNVTQTQLINWAAGGNSNLTGIVYANLFLNYKKGSIAWDSNLDTELGTTYISDTKYQWKKSNDKINFYTKFGWEFHKSWFLTVLGSFRTQYLSDYEYALDEALVEKKSKDPISKFMNPAYTDLSLGIDWKPNSIFSIYLSPVAGRITTVTEQDLREKYGVPIEKPYKAEIGLTFKAAVTYDKIKNFKVLSALTLFTPYTKKFGNFNVDWDFMISYQFLKVLNVSLTTALKYYDEVMIPDKTGHACARVQFKEVLGLGIGYSF
ncbi:MAG: DUF3078 domain-containing protein [Bacteroidales bacterium]|nr:DUF3078 domain-containing protein [Bacteroidales bacterium]